MSKCQKKYCECFSVGLKCSANCVCEECKNGNESHGRGILPDCLALLLKPGFKQTSASQKKSVKKTAASARTTSMTTRLAHLKPVGSANGFANNHSIEIVKAMPCLRAPATSVQSKNKISSTSSTPFKPKEKATHCRLAGKAPQTAHDCNVAKLPGPTSRIHEPVSVQMYQDPAISHRQGDLCVQRYYETALQPMPVQQDRCLQVEFLTINAAEDISEDDIEGGHLDHESCVSSSPVSYFADPICDESIAGADQDLWEELHGM